MHLSMIRIFQSLLFILALVQMTLVAEVMGTDFFALPKSFSVVYIGVPLLFTASDDRAAARKFLPVHAHVCSTEVTCFFMRPRWPIHPTLSHSIPLVTVIVIYINLTVHINALFFPSRVLKRTKR